VDDTARFCPDCGNAIAAPTAPPVSAPAIPAAALPPVTPAVAAPVLPAVQYGGFWVRFLAVVIDAVLLTIAVLPVYLVVFAGVAGAGYAVGMPWGGRHLVMMIAGRGLFFFAGWLYEALMWSSPRQATVGKMLLHLRVTDLEGNGITFGRATIRHLAKYMSAFVFFIGYIMAAFTNRNQALHDMMAGTVVRQD
jgi:uncharacterized RDD family membrane protein YckC